MYIMKLFKTLFLLLLLINVISSCKKTRGCTDPEAMNYNPDARKDDHSCYYFWVGQEYGGGKVFYVDQTGKHGLIALPFDLPLTAWGCTGTEISGADATSVGTGMQNTLDIVSSCSSTNAASVCNDLDTLGYDDWYLPSFEELKGLEQTLGKMSEANLGSGYYWSSSEIDASNAWIVMFANGAVLSVNKAAAYSVRPVRSF